MREYGWPEGDLQGFEDISQLRPCRGPECVLPGQCERTEMRRYLNAQLGTIRDGLGVIAPIGGWMWRQDFRLYRPNGLPTESVRLTAVVTSLLEGTYGRWRFPAMGLPIEWEGRPLPAFGEVLANGTTLITLPTGRLSLRIPGGAWDEWRRDPRHPREVRHDLVVTNNLTRNERRVQEMRTRPVSRREILPTVHFEGGRWVTQGRDRTVLWRSS